MKPMLATTRRAKLKTDPKTEKTSWGRLEPADPVMCKPRCRCPKCKGERAARVLWLAFIARDKRGPAGYWRADDDHPAAMPWPDMFAGIVEARAAAKKMLAKRGIVWEDFVDEAKENRAEMDRSVIDSKGRQAKATRLVDAIGQLQARTKDRTLDGNSETLPDADDEFLAAVSAAMANVKTSHCAAMIQRTIERAMHDCGDGADLMAIAKEVAATDLQIVDSIQIYALVTKSRSAKVRFVAIEDRA